MCLRKKKILASKFLTEGSMFYVRNTQPFQTKVGPAELPIHSPLLHLLTTSSWRYITASARTSCPGMQKKSQIFKRADLWASVQVNCLCRTFSSHFPAWRSSFLSLVPHHDTCESPEAARLPVNSLTGTVYLFSNQDTSEPPTCTALIKDARRIHVDAAVRKVRRRERRGRRGRRRRRRRFFDFSNHTLF